MYLLPIPRFAVSYTTSDSFTSQKLFLCQQYAALNNLRILLEFSDVIGERTSLQGVVRLAFTGVVTAVILYDLEDLPPRYYREVYNLLSENNIAIHTVAQSASWN
jgi:hypothetical protein